LNGINSFSKMASWEDDDFDPDVKGFAQPSDKWDGEDADDDDVKDDWEDDDEEAEAAPKETVEKKKKVPLAEKIRLREEKAKKDKMKQLEEEGQEADDFEDMTPEEQAAEKLRKQKLVEEADLIIAQETFGVTPDVIPGQKTIDNCHPTTKEEFTEFSRLLTEKITKYDTQPEYTVFLESLVRDCCAGMDPDDIKRVSTTLTVLASEKLKASKGGKAKKKATKKTLVGASSKAKDDYSNYGDQYDDYEDFM